MATNSDPWGIARSQYQQSSEPIQEEMSSDPFSIAKKQFDIETQPKKNKAGYTPEQEKIMRDLIQVAAGRSEAGLFTNPLTAGPVAINELLGLFGGGMPNLPEKVVNAIGSLTGIEPKAQSEEEETARLTGALTGVHPIELAKMVSHVPELGKYLANLGQKGYQKFLGLFQQAPGELNKIAEKFGLRSIEGLDKKIPPKKPIVSAERQKKLGEEIGKTSEDAVNKILDSKLPTRDAIKEGVDLDKYYEKLQGKIDEKIAEIKEPINFDNVIDYIDRRVSQIKSTAPSLSNADKAEIRVLLNEKRQLTDVKKGPSITISVGKSSKPSRRVPKQINGIQAIDQYRNFNENVKNIYRKPQFSGNEEVVKNTYEGLKKEWIKSIKKAEPTLGEYFELSNKIFHEKSKMAQTERILNKVFSEGYNPKRLDQILHSQKQGAFLERNLGKDAISDLKDIAKYGKAAEKQILSKLKNPKTALEIVSSLSPMGLFLLLGKHAATGGLLAGVKMVKGGYDRVRGAMFTSPKASRAYSNLVEKAAKPNMKEFQEAAKYFDSIVKDEFGSEENLMQSLPEK